MNMHPVLVALVGLLVVIGLFLLFRAAMLWYWRINESISLLRDINIKLGQLVEQTPRPESNTGYTGYRATTPPDVRNGSLGNDFGRASADPERDTRGIEATY
jgi:uncharacterized protein (DUF58 family)